MNANHTPSVERLKPRTLFAFDTFIPRVPGEHHFFTNPSLQTPGLVGSYVDRSLRGDTSQDNWRQTQVIAGTRTNARFDLGETDWGRRASVGLTHGADDAWSNFSVQWDGYVQVVTPALGLRVSSSSGTRMWLDADGSGTFEPAELTDNGWGTFHAWSAASSKRLQPGVYRVRVPYEAGDLVNVFQLSAAPAATVRVAYVVPSNRTPQDGAAASLRDGLRWMQDWYRVQMDRNGFGPKTVVFETESDGVTPKIYTVRVQATDADLRRNLWGGTLSAAGDAGVPLFADGQDWLLVPECHVQSPDSTVSGGGSLGASAGTGFSTDGGVAVMGADLIPWLTPGALTDDQAYLGLHFPGLGPYPLGPAPWYDGTTVSQRSSGAHGALVHELTHGMGLPHEFVNDDNVHGNIMGNGFRGFRGAAYPFRYGADDGYLSYAQALALNTSPFLNPDADDTDQDLPRVSDVTNGTASLVNGEVRIHFHATDEAGLAAAVLTRNGEIVGQQPLSGTAFDGSFDNHYFDPGQASAYEVLVYDVNGNRGRAVTSVTGLAGNLAPRPFVRVSPPTVEVKQFVTVNAYRSTDPEGAPLSVRCDFGDGQFTGGEGAGLSKRFGQPGRYLVRARVTDAAGNVSVSSPVPLRVLAAGPSLASGVVNDGTSAQRSTVNSVQLRFDRPVVPGANALRLSRPGGGSVPPMTIGNPSGDGRTFVVSFGGAGPKDGVYDLPCRRSRTSPSR